MVTLAEASLLSCSAALVVMAAAQTQIYLLTYLCDSQAQAAVDQMALDEGDSDDERRASFDDSSDEDLDSAATIRQQPESVMAQQQQQQQVENMDISSTDG